MLRRPTRSSTGRQVLRRAVSMGLHASIADGRHASASLYYYFPRRKRRAACCRRAAMAFSRRGGDHAADAPHWKVTEPSPLSAPKRSEARYVGVSSRTRYSQAAAAARPQTRRSGKLRRCSRAGKRGRSISYTSTCARCEGSWHVQQRDQVACADQTAGARIVRIRRMRRAAYGGSHPERAS